MNSVIIIGGHGKVALLTEQILSGPDNVTVDAVIRNPEHGGDVVAHGANPVIFDIEEHDTEAIAALLQGHDAVVWSAGAGGGNPERTYSVDRDAAIRTIDAAIEAGVKRFVMVSYMGAGPEHGVPEDNSFFPYAEAKTDADAYLRTLGNDLDWTILQPTTLTLDGPTRAIDVVPYANGRVPDDASGRTVSRANVARVIEATLEDDSTIGRTIPFMDGSTPIREAIKL